MTLRAKYRIVKVANNIVWIVDLCSGAHPSMSITNDAEDVVEDVLRQAPGHRIVYRDTDGRWDELAHDGKEFTNFVPADSLGLTPSEAGC